MKRNWGIIFIMLCYVLVILTEIGIELELEFEEGTWNPFDYARITDVDYKAEVIDEPNNSGKILVTERLTFDIHAFSKNNLFWELWRDLPEDTVDGLKIKYKVNSVKQILDDNTKIIYNESPKLYWEDSDYLKSSTKYGYGPQKWYHSEGPYNERLRDYECLMIYVDGMYREKAIFEIEYEMSNASLRYNDCSELYLSLYSEETIKYLDSFRAQILFPENDMPSNGNYKAYTYGTNSGSFPFTESTTLNPGYHTFLFELDKKDLKFSPVNQFIEFNLISYGADKNIFTEYAPMNIYSDENVLKELLDEQKEYELTQIKAFSSKIIVFFFASISTIFILHYTNTLDRKIKNKYNFYEPTMKFDYFRDIPSNLDPNFAATLAFCKDKPKLNNENGYAATLLSLIHKKYIDLDRITALEDWNSNNIKIRILKKPTPLIQFKLEDILEDEKTLEALTPIEEHYFNLINRHSHGNDITMKDFQEKVSMDYSYTDSFVRNIKNSIIDIGVEEKYFQKANYEEPKQQLRTTSTLFMVLGILLLTVVNLISYQTHLNLAFGAFFILGFGFIYNSLKIRKLSKKYILLTQFGEDEYAKWKGLYEFLNSETLMNERTVIELPIWEQYLIYATAFGISEKVIKALEIRCPELYQSSMLSNPYYRSRNFYTHSHSFGTSVNHASSFARYNSYSGGYGGSFGGHGYGGGGRGGGGGRRRSLKVIIGPKI